MKLKKYYVILALFMAQFATAQEGIPVYLDYLQDNLYLLHPSMAGASQTSKLRGTARSQWAGLENAPALQTVSINSRVGEKVGLGGILFNDGNGFFGQTGAYATFAYHLLLSRSFVELNQLSFGISVGVIQGSLDETNFDLSDFDPVIAGVVQTDSYANVDFGVSYNFLNFSAHATVFEPSLLYQATDETQEATFDFNAKAYYKVDWGKLWGGLSYRRSLDGSEFTNDGVAVDIQKLQQISPFVGGKYDRFLFGYTYSYQSNSVVLVDAGFHQITLGYNLGDDKEPYDCNCPAVN